ncbi:MAG: YncE family protein [Polyangiales bacterium]
MPARPPAVAALALAALARCADEPAAPPARLFVADERGGTVTVVDGRALRATATVDLAEAREGRAVRYLPHNVQATPDGREVWATAASQAFYTSGFAGADDEQVVVIDAARAAVAARVPLTGVLAHVVFDAAGRRAYVTASQAGEVVELDVAARAVTRRFRLGPRRLPHGARACAGRLFVACTGGRSVAAIDLATGAVDEVPVGGQPIQVACARDGSAAYTALQDARTVVRVAFPSRAVSSAPLPDTARGPAQVFLSPDGARLWVADQGLLTSTSYLGNRVYEVDAATLRTVGSAEVGRGAHGVVLSRDGAVVYVTGTLDDSVAALDAATRRRLGDVPVGAMPNGITLVDASGGVP